jgi:transposase
MLKAQINKTDRNDARGIAQMMRVGLYRPVHVKTLRSQKLRVLLTHRKLLQSKAVAMENDLRATLRNFGLKVGVVGTVKFEARIKELVENLADLAVLVEPLLIVQRAAAPGRAKLIARAAIMAGTEMGKGAFSIHCNKRGHFSCASRIVAIIRFARICASKTHSGRGSARRGP